MNDNKVRIFVSSPADVEHERAIVRDIVERLGHEFLPYFEIQPILWEEEALTADRTFQAGLIRPADCDIVLVVFWTRLGSPLPQEPYEGMTGTEWEFFNAVEMSSAEHRPEVLVYKKTNPKLVDITNTQGTLEAIEDRKRLEDFFQRNFFNEDQTFRRAFRTFDNDAAFSNLVEVQLRKLLNRRIFARKGGALRGHEWRGSPFRAEQPFDFDDERIFTGREGETRDLLHRLQDQMAAGPAFLLVSGPSGCGKSSLIRAGLLPRLARPYQIDGVAACRWCLVDPRENGGDPLQVLSSALCSQDVLGDMLGDLGIAPEFLGRSLGREPELVAGQVRAALQNLARAVRGDSGESAASVRLVVVVDPLDALFADTDLSADVLEAFSAALIALAQSGAAWVIVAMRSDSLRHLPALGPLAGLADQSTWLQLEIPAAARIREVMEIPALVAGLQYESQKGRNLVELLEVEASDLPLWPPLLQGTLDRLYQVRQASAEGAGSLTVDALRQSGGLAGEALDRAQRLWTGLNEEARGSLPRLCRALITLESTVDRGSVARTGDLDSLELDPSCRRVVHALIDARLAVAEGHRDPVLLTVCHEPDYSLKGYLIRVFKQTRADWRVRLARRSGTKASEILSTEAHGASEPDSGTELDWRGYRRTVRLVHPALLERWAPVRDWLALRDNREALQLRYQISRQAQLWKRTDCNQEYLLGEAGFAAASRFSRLYGAELEPAEAEFLDQSEKHLRFQRRRNAIVRVTGIVLAVLLLLATGSAFWARDASHKATVNLHRSRLNAADLDIARGNTPNAVVLALDAARYLPGQALDTLSRAFTTNRLVAMARASGNLPGRPIAPSFSDDGERLITAEEGQGAMLWRLQGARFVQEGALAGPELGIHTVLFVGTGEGAGVIGIGPKGVWRFPAEAGAVPDWPCGHREQTQTARDPGGRYLAIAHAAPSDQQAVCVLDLQQPGQLLFDVEVHQSEIRSLVFSPDGSRLLTASRDGLAKVLDARTGAVLLSLPAEGPLSRPVNRAVFDSAGGRIATAAADETVRVYDSDGALLHELSEQTSGDRRFRVHKTAVRDAAFSPDGRYLVAGDDEGQVVRWDLSAEAAAVVLGHHGLSIERVRLNSRGGGESSSPLVLTASLDKTARLWDLDSGKELAVFSHDAAVTGARFSTDGARILTYSNLDGSARLWSVEPVSRLSYTMGHDDHVWHVAVAAAPKELDPDRDRDILLLASADFDGRASLWRYDRTAEDAVPSRLRVLEGHTDKIRRVAFSPSAKRLSTAAYDGTARVWDLTQSGADCVLEVGTDGARVEVYQALFSPGEDWLLTASNDVAAPLRLWDLGTCGPLEKTDSLLAGGARVQAAEVFAGDDGTVLIAAAADDGSLRVLRRQPDGRIDRLCELQLHSNPVLDLAFAPDRGAVATASEDGRAALVQLTAEGCGEPLYLEGHEDNLYSVRFSPDGDFLVTSSLDGTARVWASDGEAAATLSGHKDRIYHAEFSPDGRWILTASRDATVRLWQSPDESAATGEDAYLVLDGELGGVAYATFSPAGNYIAGAYWENAAVLWRVWAEDEDEDGEDALRGAWGEDRSRLAIVREADRFRRDNRLDDRAAVQAE